MKSNAKKEQLRSLTEGAIVISMTIVLSYLQVWRMPQGGSVTLENIPLLVYALRRGGSKGIYAGIVAGLLQLLLGGYVVHPAQAILDYPAAFAALGTAGFLSRRWPLGVFAGVFARFACHVLSGVVFFASYAPEGSRPLVYSAVYNGTYMLPGLVLSMIFIWIISKRGRLLNI